MEQSILARLRFGHCSLAAHRSRWQPLDRMCACGQNAENVEHYLLRCPSYNRSRKRLMRAVAAVHKGHVNEELLLGLGPVQLDFEQRRVVSRAVAEYVLETKKDFLH